MTLIRLICCLLASSLCAAPAFCHVLTLYDAAKGTTPDAQGWDFFVTGGGQTPPGKTGLVTLSTVGSDSYRGGYMRVSPVALNRRRGYTLAFVLQVPQEAHLVPNRAGVDLIVIGSDGLGLELGFWMGQVWAQSDHPLFRHAESASVATTRLTHYLLAVQGDSYQLSANGVVVLVGPLRDYRAFNGPINPYRTPNLLFLGDDTRSAEGELRLARLSLRVPESPQGRHQPRAKP